MPAVSHHLKKETELLKLGAGLLRAYCQDHEQGTALSAEDMRMATYAMQLVIDNCVVAKRELVLYEALKGSAQWDELPPDVRRLVELNLQMHEECRTQLLELRLLVDEYEQDPARAGLVWLQLKEFLANLSSYIEHEDSELIILAEKILDSTDQNFSARAERVEKALGVDQLQGPRLIISRLRAAKGLGAA